MNLCINDFEGPLDLLLHLVKSSKMDIYTIDTYKVIEEYLKFINSLDKNDLDNASEYLVMAAELIHLKSRMLVNNDLEEETEDEYSINSEDDLKTKLALYEQYKNVRDAFKDLEKNRQDYYTKIPESISDYKENKKVANDGEVTIDDLLNAFLELKKREQVKKPLNTRITKKELSVEEKTIYIRNMIKKSGKIKFDDLFESFDKDNVIVTFLSILNMSKNDEIILTQKKNFANIYIERK